MFQVLVRMKKFMREKTLSFAYFEAPYTTKWKKNRQTDKRTLKDCRFENIDYSKYQLIFVTAEEVFSMPFLSRLKQLPHLFNHRLYVCLFLSEDSASGFLFNSFCLVTCYFPECSDAQLIRGCFAIQQPPRAGIFSPSPPPSPHRLYLQTGMGG